MSEPYRPQAEPRRGLPGWGWLLIGCGCLGVAMVPIMAAILFPVFMQAREKARQTACLSNLRQLSTAMLMYAQDYDGRLPPGRRWMDAVGPHAGREPLFHCPSARTTSSWAFGYAFNGNLSTKKLEKLANPATARMLYDSSSVQRNATDPVTSLANPPRHTGGNNIGYADGHVKWTRFGGTTGQPGGGRGRGVRR